MNKYMPIVSAGFVHTYCSLYKKLHGCLFEITELSSEISPSREVVRGANETVRGRRAQREVTPFALVFPLDG